MNVTGTSARIELVANANLMSVNTTGSALIGTPFTSVVYTTPPDIAYSLGMFISGGDTLAFDFETGAVTGTVTGTSQVETATVTAASGVTSNGTCNVVFTAAAVTGSPITVPVALTTAQTTATLIAVEIRAALTANTAIAAEYTIGGTGATVTATRINKRRNDTTLNIAIPAGLGITAAATSANTTTGVGESKAYRIDGTAWNQTDFEGKPLETATKLYSVLVKVISAEASAEVLMTGASTNKAGSLTDIGDFDFSASVSGEHQWNARVIDFEATSDDIQITIDIQAGT